MKKKLELVILSILLILCFTACGEAEDNTGNYEEKNISEVTLEHYVDDEVVNKFINDFNKESEIDIENVEESLSGYGYKGDWGDYYVELSYGSSSGIVVVFNATADAPDMAGLDDALKNTLVALKLSNEKDVVLDAWKVFLDDNYMQEGSAENVAYLFAPTVELSNGRSLGHIELTGTDYE